MDDLRLVTVTAFDGSERAEVMALLGRIEAGTGHAALSEHKLSELRSAMPPTDLGPTGGHLSAGIMVWATGGTGLIGYAQISGDIRSHQFAVETAIDVSVVGPGPVADALVVTAVDHVAAHNGGALRLWVARATEADDVRAAEHGFRIERNLIQLRCPLPLPPRPGRSGPPPRIATRPFRPGQDEAAWLVTNNRAFAGHPEQGHWELATLIDREQEQWFDPRGFLLLESEGRLAGSCWTKIHAHTNPPMGEIYVIGVDPDFHGRGWGRSLTQAGLDWLASQGLAVGMLYVDGDNTAAVSMYRSMGFVEHHVDRAYIRKVDRA